ncbi:MAG TPA: tetratricopeptide repeat protein [Blastocatellia bacterium]|nr:tetratricopeptide repeat protein [Blastocatellia bacterium]
MSKEVHAILINKGDGMLYPKPTDRTTEIFHLALNVAQILQYREGIAVAESRLGTTSYLLYQYEDATRRYKNALKIYEELVENRELAAALQNVGLALNYNGDAANAQSYFQRAYNLYNKLGLQREASEVQGFIASSQLASGENDAAKQSLEKSQTEGAGVKTLLDNGEALYAQQEYEEALVIFRKALAAAQQPPIRSAILAATRNLSNCLYALGQYEQALESYQQTRQLQQQAGDAVGIADTWLRLGNCHYALGDLDEAIDHYKQSFESAKETKTALTMAESLSSIGLAWFVQGENKLALDHYYQSLNHYATAGDKDGIAQALQSVGNANFRLQNYRLAFEAFQNARYLLTEAGRVDDAHEVLLAIGLVHFAQKSYAFALEAYQKSLTHFETINNKSLIALALYRIGLVRYAEENFPEALSFAERAATFATQAESHETLWRAQFEIGRAQLRLTQADKAKQAWLQSVATIERMRANLRGNDTDSAVERTAPFIGLVELLVEENNPVEAFHYAERANAQVLWGILQGSRNRITKTLTPLEAENEQKLRRAALTLSARLDRAKRKNAGEMVIQRLREQLHKARADLTTLVNQLFVRHPQLKIYRGEAPPIKAGEAYAFVSDPKRALLKFVVTEQQVLLFVLTKAPKQTQIELNTYKLDGAQLQEQVLQFRDQITSKSEDYVTLARTLFERLLKPASSQLTGKTSLTIVPDGILWALPFAALQSADNRFWIEDAAINYATSASALREMTKLARTRTATTAPSLLAIAPSGWDAALLDKLRIAPLPNAETSAQQWQQLYGVRGKLHIGNDAREANVQQVIGTHSIAHFAAPALINNYRPLYSFVALSSADATKPKSGLLPLWKLTNWNLRAELLALPDAVVLPVERRSGNGFAGVAWASYVAGSSSTLLSQWQTENTEWLTTLHQQLKTRAPNALQQATIQLLQRPEFRHPVHWAAFALVGATR